MKAKILYILLAASIIGLLLRIYKLDIGLGFSDENVLYEAMEFVLENPKNILTLTVILVHAPLYWAILPFFYTLLSPFAEPSILLLRYISASVGVLFIPFLYYIVKKEIGKDEALISSVLLALTGYFVVISRIVYPEITITLVFVVLVLYFLKFIENVTFKTSMLYGLLLTFIILLKEPAILFIPATVLFLIWDKNWDVLKNKYFWFGSMLPFVFAAPIVLYGIYVILPKYVSGIALWEFPAFYQMYLGRSSHIQNIVPGVFRIFHNFALFSSLPMTILFLFGTGYGVYRREKLDKYLLCVTIVFLVFFAGMGQLIPISEYKSYIVGLGGMEFVDWHIKWIILPLLLLSATSIVRIYREDKVQILLRNKKIKILVFIMIIAFVLYIILYDFSIINALNEYMKENLKLVPLFKHDPRAEEIAKFFN